MATVIREAAVVDRASVTELLFQQLSEHSVCPSRSVVEAAVARLVERPDLGRLLVAEVDGEVAGLAALSFLFTLEHGGTAAWLEEIYVAPACRGAGLGSLLIVAACAAASAAGARALDLEIEAGHERAAELYERHGFARHARQRWFRILPQALAATPEPLALPLTGGCLCAAIRYRATAAPLDVTHCHCVTCRRASGAPLVTWATFAVSRIEWTQGVPHERRSSATAVRGFCADCGTALSFREDARPRSIDITAGSLDTPECLTPVDHTFVRSRLPWLRLADELPRFAGVNPGETSVSE